MYINRVAYNKLEYTYITNNSILSHVQVKDSFNTKFSLYAGWSEKVKNLTKNKIVNKSVSCFSVDRYVCM